MPVTLTSPTEMLNAEAVSARIRCSRIAWLEAFTPTCAEVRGQENSMRMAQDTQNLQSVTGQ